MAICDCSPKKRRKWALHKITYNKFTCSCFVMLNSFADEWGLSNYFIDSLGPSAVIWRPRSGSALAQVMVCCLTAPSHYLNQCWLILSKVKRHVSQGSFTINTSTTIYWNYSENCLYGILFKSPRGQWVKRCLTCEIDNYQTPIKHEKSKPCA